MKCDQKEAKMSIGFKHFVGHSKEALLGQRKEVVGCVVLIFTNINLFSIQLFLCCGAFTMPNAETETDNKWLVKKCVEVFIVLRDRDRR